jgi:DNA-directed RNA polymerase specialized sigma24 family protein
MAKRERVRLRWVPQWDEKVRGWAIKFITQNQWRCDKIHEFDDLVQDAYLLFLKIAERYPKVNQPQHFMALFKRALANQIHDHARYMRRKRIIHQDTHKDAIELYSDVGEENNQGYLNALIAEAPSELRLALTIIETEPEKLRNVTSRHSENLNMKLRRILGIKGKFDFATALKTLIE